MKKTILSLLFILCIIQLKAQTFDISVQANTGFSHYVGQSTVSSTFLDVASVSGHSGYPNGVGNRLAPTYGADIQFQYTFKCNFLLGAQAGYEVISSKTNINGVYDGNSSAFSNETPATGYVTEHDNYFNLNPYFGYRFNLNKVRLDIMAGLDVAFGSSIHNTVDVHATDGTYYNNSYPNYGKPANETRPRFGFAAYYKRFGITGSWSIEPKSPVSYADVYVPPYHMEIYRLGISYKLW